MYEMMEETVDLICDSMVNRPNEWVIGVHTVDNKETGVRLWINGVRSSICEMWDGHNTREVFSYEQGERIYSAFTVMSETKATQAQQYLINRMRPKKLKSDKWSDSWLGKMLKTLFNWR